MRKFKKPQVPPKPDPIHSHKQLSSILKTYKKDKPFFIELSNIYFPGEPCIGNDQNILDELLHRYQPSHEYGILRGYMTPTKYRSKDAFKISGLSSIGGAIKMVPGVILWEGKILKFEKEGEELNRKSISTVGDVRSCIFVFALSRKYEIMSWLHGIGWHESSAGKAEGWIQRVSRGREFSVAAGLVQQELRLYTFFRSRRMLEDPFQSKQTARWLLHKWVYLTQAQNNELKKRFFKWLEYSRRRLDRALEVNHHGYPHTVRYMLPIIDYLMEQKTEMTPSYASLFR